MLDAATDLFHARGIHATTVDEILAASGTGKGQMYHYFGGKDDVVHEVMCRHEQGFRDALEDESHSIRSWNDLERWFLVHLEKQESFDFERGCPIGTVAASFHPSQKTVRDDLERVFDLMRRPLISFFEHQKQSGEIVADADPHALATFCIATIQGAMLLARVEKRPEPVLASIRHALSSLRKSLEPTRKKTARRPRGRQERKK